ncbi:MAG: Gfo/Idh/MocA family oxidoreductase, partial [Chloroflexota bacterium]
MSRVVKVGVIGYGYWGPNLVRNFNSLPNAELVAVADRSEDQLDRVRNAYPNVTTVNDYREFFEMGIEAVAIATPPSTHHAIG